MTKNIVTYNTDFHLALEQSRNKRITRVFTVSLRCFSRLKHQQLKSSSQNPLLVVSWGDHEVNILCIFVPFTNRAGMLDPSQNYSDFQRYQLRLKQGILAATEIFLCQNMLSGPIRKHIYGILKNVLKSQLAQRAPS